MRHAAVCVLLCTIPVAVAVSTSADPVKIEYKDLKAIKQLTNWGCWATAATMVRNWSLERSGLPGQTVEQTIKAGDPTLLSIYVKDERGTTAAEEEAFNKSLGFTVLKQVNLSLAEWASLLTKYGPVSVTIKPNTGKGTLHGIVLTGLVGDGTAAGTNAFYVDPDGAQSKTVPFAAYVRMYESGGAYALQIARLSSPVR